MNWIDTSEKLPPDGKIVETIILLDGSEINHQRLVRQGKLWFFPDMSMYVYYTPTHWREESHE